MLTSAIKFSLVVCSILLNLGQSLQAGEPFGKPVIEAAAPAAISGKFSLQDHLGNPVTQDSYAGHYRLVFFGFTNCPDICPTTLYNIARLMRELGDDSNKLVPLFISVDHENDSVERLANYVAAFHPSVVGLTGSAKQISLAAEGFNTTYGKHQDDSGQLGSWYHSSYLYLMDKDGKLLDLFSFSTSTDILVEELAGLH